MGSCALHFNHEPLRVSHYGFLLSRGQIEPPGLGYWASARTGFGDGEDFLFGLGQQVPAVRVEELTERTSPEALYIRATIFVERDGRLAN